MNKSLFTVANDKLKDFLDNKIIDYNKYRNYDYGKENANKVVSGLSPYISNGLIQEKDIIEHLKISKNKSDKFKQEILWRTYWKGWLEQNTNIWDLYKKNLDYNKRNVTHKSKSITYELAIKGKTNIKPYDYWVQQLKKSGYLHNHSRMWFASIWTHYFKLPWELGANFFMENLLDGDIASNTLSWRWVAGIQTKGKTYIAQKDNINKYTLNKFGEFYLPKLSLQALEEEKRVSNKIHYKSNINFNKKNKSCLFVLENNLNIRFIEKNRNAILEIIIIRFSFIGMNKNNIVNEFRNKACEDFLYLCSEFNIKVSTYNIEQDIKNLIYYLSKKKIKSIITEYIPVGYEKDIMSKFKKYFDTNSITILELLDPFYIKSWSYCNKGYFNFKKNFDKFI